MSRLPLAPLAAGLLALCIPLAASAQESPAVTHWQIEQDAAGMRLRVELDQPVRIQNRAIVVLDGAEVLGIGQESEDRMSLTVPLADGTLLRRNARIRLDTPGFPAQEDGVVRGPATVLLPPARTNLAVLQEDPGMPGSYEVESIDYSLGDSVVSLPGTSSRTEFTGRLYAPRTKSSLSPLVLLLHGRHAVCYRPSDMSQPFQWPCEDSYRPTPSYLGYETLAHNLASHGFVVATISANGINQIDKNLPDLGAAARAKLIQEHVNYLARAHQGGTPELGDRLRGLLDMNTIGLMGHSRGGEGVVKAATIGQENGNSPFKAVFALAPTDFSRWKLANVPLAVALPYCDGDVSDLSGQLYVDDSRHAFQDSVLRSTLIMHGSNHNFFNTVWTPGSGPDAWDDAQNSDLCGPTSSYRLTSTQQNQVGASYIAAFFRLTLANERQFLPLFDGSPVTVPSLQAADVRSIPTAPKSQRYDIDLFQAPNPALASDLDAHLCQGGGDEGQGLPACTQSGITGAVPHWVSAFLKPNEPSRPMMKLSWSKAGGSLRVLVPAGQVDASAYKFLSLGAMASSHYTGRQPLGMNVTIVDTQGRRATAQVASHSDALQPVPGAGSWDARTLLRSVHIPLEAFRGADTRAIKQVELTATSPTGEVFLSDLTLSNPGVR